MAPDSRWGMTPQQSIARECTRRGRADVVAGCRALVRGEQTDPDLLVALEAWAVAHGRHRLVLDTETGSDAERVYQRHGWQRVGEVPDFCLTADGALASTTYYTKGLARG